MDTILDKISTSGYDTLSKEEKEFLFKQKAISSFKRIIRNELFLKKACKRIGQITINVSTE